MGGAAVMVTEYLKEHGAEGEENAIAAHVIAKNLGLTGRALTKQIREERVAGNLICARHDNEGGYFMPVKTSEILKQRDMLEHGMNRRREVIEPFSCFLNGWELSKK